MDSFLYSLKKQIPAPLFAAIQKPYHRVLAYLSALWFGYPGRSIRIVAVTGTKGKSTVTELVSAILREAGHTVALSNTIHFSDGKEEARNLFKMTMPGRGFVQGFLKRAERANAEYAVIEMTSEGVKLFRHLHVPLDVLIFTNLSPEHIESHGSFEAYKSAKLALRDSLEHSAKSKKLMIANIDDPHGKEFLEVKSAERLPYSIKNTEPYTLGPRGILFTIDGVSIHSPLMGLFNLSNLVAAVTFAKAEGVPMAVIKRAIEKLDVIKGRVEFVRFSDTHALARKQNFRVVVDYAHTPDSLEKLYQAFPESRKICVLGNTGGGRDTWKRPEMGRIAEKYCNEVILTNEDPYDEAPEKIVGEMAAGMEKEPNIIMDRRSAIKQALSLARENDIVLISGKGTDPFIMGPRNSKLPWSDERVAMEELEKVLSEL